MNTKPLLLLSGLVLGITGILLNFFPEETLELMDASSSRTAPVLIQLTGALYFGFGVTNFMSKGARMGGIYNRPLLVGNLAHFATGALALIKSELSFPLIGVAVVYGIFAVLFGILFFKSPKLDQGKGNDSNQKPSS